MVGAAYRDGWMGGTAFWHVKVVQFKTLFSNFFPCSLSGLHSVNKDITVLFWVILNGSVCIFGLQFFGSVSIFGLQFMLVHAFLKK